MLRNRERLTIFIERAEKFVEKQIETNLNLV